MAELWISLTTKTVANRDATARYRLVITPDLATACMDFVEVVFIPHPLISESSSGFMLDFLIVFATT